MAKGIAEIGVERISAGAEEASRLQGFYQRNERWIIGSGAVFIFFVLWEAITRSGAVNPLPLGSGDRVHRAPRAGEADDPHRDRAAAEAPGNLMRARRRPGWLILAVVAGEESGFIRQLSK